jgi:hypothetical protein
LQSEEYEAKRTDGTLKKILFLQEKIKAEERWYKQVVRDLEVSTSQTKELPEGY